MRGTRITFAITLPHAPRPTPTPACLPALPGCQHWIYSPGNTGYGLNTLTVGGKGECLDVEAWANKPGVRIHPLPLITIRLANLTPGVNQPPCCHAATLAHRAVREHTDLCRRVYGPTHSTTVCLAGNEHH